jgi:hypothetical protein
MGTDVISRQLEDSCPEIHSELQVSLARLSKIWFTHDACLHCKGSPNGKAFNQEA